MCDRDLELDSPYHFEPYYDVQDSILEFSDRLPEQMSIDEVFSAIDMTVSLMKSQGVFVDAGEIVQAKEDVRFEVVGREEASTYFIPLTMTSEDGEFSGVYLALTFLYVTSGIYQMDIDFAYPWDFDDWDDLEDEE